jgi:hypothetical protein
MRSCSVWYEQPVGRSEIDQELVPIGDYLLDR